MWRHVVILFVILLGGWLLGAAMEADAQVDLSEDVIQTVAAEAAVDPTDLKGALLTVGEPDARRYLIHSGELAPPPPALNLAIERRLDCISWYESKHTPSARNRSSGAAGQYQFLLSTWATTPQGRAGLSPYDPVAARQAARWMIAQGRIREWVPVQRGLC